MDSFSVTMPHVSTRIGYAMALIAVVIKVMNRRHAVLFVVCVLDSFVSLTLKYNLSNLKQYLVLGAVVTKY